MDGLIDGILFHNLDNVMIQDLIALESSTR
jgi:hypothetical protein